MRTAVLLTIVLGVAPKPLLDLRGYILFLFHWGGPTGPPQPCVIWGLLPEALYPTPAILPLLKGVWAVPSSPACSDAQSLELIMAGGFRWFLGVPLDNSIAQ